MRFLDQMQTTIIIYSNNHIGLHAPFFPFSVRLHTQEESSKITNLGICIGIAI